MPGLRSDLAKGKADTVGMCDSEKMSGSAAGRRGRFVFRPRL